MDAFALGDVWEAQIEALDALGKSGTVALPEILQVMDQPPVPYDGKVMIRASLAAPNVAPKIRAMCTEF